VRSGVFSGEINLICNEELRNIPIQAHPLAKWQLITCLIWCCLGIPIFSVEEKTGNILLWLSLIPFLAMSILTIRIGWLQFFKKELIVYPFQLFGFRIYQFFGGSKRIRQVKTNWGKPGIIRSDGFLNLFAGALCALMVIALVLSTLLGCPLFVCAK
jgi:hypothetical protein